MARRATGPVAAVRADDRHAAPRPVRCARCGTTVEVVKFSPQHTSVQWTAAAVDCCAEFRARAAEGTRSALVGGCADLRMSIDDAVAAGLLAIAPPSYDSLDGDAGRTAAYPAEADQVAR
jgi:hypothetical protein